MFVAGVDGCRGGWVAYKVELPSGITSVEVMPDLSPWLTSRPAELGCVVIDIPIGLLDGARACDRAARVLLGSDRRSSVFSPPCRAALQATTYEEGCAVNQRVTGKKISLQCWNILSKIKAVDDVLTSQCSWAYEVHPEVSFRALAGHAMQWNKKTASGRRERIALLREVFPEIEEHLAKRPSGVQADDLLDAAVAAWTALRLNEGSARAVCEVERDTKGLRVGIWY